MAIHNPQLSPKQGYVEVEINGIRKYKNIQTGDIIDPCDSISLTHEEINAMVVTKIREKYDVNEEFKIVNLGISDSTNEEYIAYRNYVEECVKWGNALENGNISLINEDIKEDY